jgi:outer membrane protein assembly factor BamB
MHRPRLLVFVAGLLGLAGLIHADDWPHWRGPTATGVSNEKNLPATWSEKDNVAWKAALRGGGVSSPVIFGNRVFVTSQVGRGNPRPGPSLVQGANAAEAGELPLGRKSAGAAANEVEGGVKFLVTALDRGTGKQLWEYESPLEANPFGVHEKHNLASPSPVTDGERVYAWFGSGLLVALDMNGKLVWQRDLGREFGPFNINWGHASSPILYKGTVILVCYHPQTAYLLAVDSSTGTNRWKVDRPRGVISYSTPMVVETTGGKAELVVNSSAGLAGHDVSSGELLWQFDEANSYPIPIATQNEGVIYTSRGYRSSPFMAIRAGGKGNVAETNVLWRVPSGAPYCSSIIYHDGLIYMVSDVGVVTATEAKTGERVWQERVGGVYSASPIIADGKIYFLSEDGEAVVMAVGRAARVLSRNRLDARILASPAIAGGKLFIRSDDALYAIGK